MHQGPRRSKAAWSLPGIEEGKFGCLLRTEKEEGEGGSMWRQEDEQWRDGRRRKGVMGPSSGGKEQRDSEAKQRR